MRFKSLARSCGSALLAVSFASWAPGASAFELREQEAHKAAIDAYIYAYPLVTMELTRRGATNVTARQGDLIANSLQQEKKS